jgi:hypothetical protein
MPSADSALPKRWIHVALGALLGLSLGCGSGSGDPDPAPPASVAPSITTQPRNQTVTAGQTATFTVTATGTAPLSYQWRKGAQTLPGATAATYTTEATTLADSGAVYSVVITNSVSSVTSGNAILTVNAAPTGYVPPGLLAQPAPSPEIDPSGQKYYVAAVATNGTGSLASPFNSIQAGLNAAQPGDSVVVMPGTYPMTTRIKTVRDGSAAHRISLVAYDPADRPVLERSGGYGGDILLIKNPYFLVDGLVMDGKFTAVDFSGDDADGRPYYRVVMNIAHYGTWVGSTETTCRDEQYGYNGDYAIVRNCEMRNSSVDGVNIAADHVLLENCEIHHCLRGTFENQKDAHCIHGDHLRDLILRNCDIHHATGDCFQVDPDIEYRAGKRLWDNILVENCRLWTGSLAEDAGPFLAGQNPGENGIDTKTFEGTTLEFRPRMTVRNIEVFGWEQNGYISNRSVFNVKYQVDWTIDGVIARDNQYVFRVRGDWENPVQGHATLTLRNALVYNNLRAFRVERLIPNLHVYNCTFANNGIVMEHKDTPGEVGYDAATFEMRNCLFLGAKPSDASHASNLSGEASWFQNAAADQFALAAGSPAVDAGVAIGEVATDLLNIPRPQGTAYDVGAYEQED